MQWLRQWIGLDVITDLQIHMYQKISRIEDTLHDLQVIKAKQDAILQGMGRILSHVEHQFAKDPHDPKVIAESKEIGDKVIEKLEAEAKVRQHYGYDK